MTEQKSTGGKRTAKGGQQAVSSELPSWFHFLIVLAVAVGLTWIFWAPLWEGGSLIGGDLFPYFFPQKAFLADQFKAGVIPLWNPLTGHGYPTIAESQTGVCYPPDWLAYRFLSITPAYNTVQIVHYILAFAGTWLLARKLGCTFCGALLAALSFVYGWFPPRICLEWAIVTGAYLPWVMWCAESFLQDRRGRHLLGLCLLLALQLLAGHFHVAFLTQLTLAVYAPLRGRLMLPSPLEGEGPGVRGMSSTGEASVASVGWDESSSPTTFRETCGGTRKASAHPTPTPSPSRGEGRVVPIWFAIWGALVVAFLLAAVQLAPTWELKQRSQRSEVSVEHQPGYGHLPYPYWSQAIVPWLWYPGDVDERLAKLPNSAGGAGTNKVEAHLYFGILPLMLALGGLAMNWRNRSDSARAMRLWMLIGLAFLLYTPGWFLPITQHLPGFSFFRGPGRYGLITSLAVALAAGHALTGMLDRLRGRGRFIVTALVLLVTAADLWWVAQQPWYSVMLRGPVVEQRAVSPLREFLSREIQPVRLFAPMANFANLLGVSATPVYLGIGPQEYFDPQFTMPVGPNGGLDPAGDPAQIRWLQAAGVTHILSLDRLPLTHWPAKLVWSGNDPLVNAAFGRRNEPVFLYQLQNSRGRIAWENSGDPASTATVINYVPHQIRAECTSVTGGRIVLTDLNYPGWRVAVDGQNVPTESSGMFRAVTVGPGTHEIVWSYRPSSVYWGTLISVTALLGLLSASVLCHQRRRHISNPLPF